MSILSHECIITKLCPFCSTDMCNNAPSFLNKKIFFSPAGGGRIGDWDAFWAGLIQGGAVFPRD